MAEEKQRVLSWNKIPLALSMFGSSVLIGISIYETFPIEDPILRYASSVIGGVAFDLTLVSTVFSIKKNNWSYVTIFAAFVIGLCIALDLYLKWNLNWLHAFYTLLSVSYALHIARNNDSRSDASLLHKLLNRDSDSDTDQKVDQSGTQNALRGAERSDLISEDRSESIGAVGTSQSATEEATQGTDQTLDQSEDQSKSQTKKQTRVRYACVHCGKRLDSVQQQTASRVHGHCRYCKGKKPRVKRV